jgi:hypothetical protein
MLAVVMFASASAECLVTPDADGVVTAAQVTAALQGEADPTYLPPSAFKECMELVTITLPTGLTRIGNTVFKDATNLAGTVIIPEGVTKVGVKIFYGQPHLTTVVFPASLEYINNALYGIFLGCTSLTTVCGATNPELTTDQQNSCPGSSNSNCLMGDSPATFASLESACPAGLIPTTTTTSPIADEEGGACSAKCCKGTWSGTTDCTTDVDGLICVQHDTTSGHSHHRCYEDTTHSRLCRCQCANSADAWD